MKAQKTYLSNMNKIKLITINALPIAALYSFMVIPKIDYGQVLGFMDARDVEIVSPEVVPTPSQATGVTSSPKQEPEGSRLQDTDTDEGTTLPCPAPVDPKNTMQKIDVWVGKYVDYYFENAGQRSEARMIMHCLLNRETKHDYVKSQGDGGRANGVLQFHLPTWERARKEMIRQSEATEISSPLNTEDAIKTTVWVLRESGKSRKQRVISILEWGPVLRMSQGKTNATCPVPTWINGN